MTEDTRSFYGRHAGKASAVAISEYQRRQAPDGLEHSKPTLPLVLAGPVQPGEEPFFQSEVKPHLDDEKIRYLGEVGEEKKKLYAGARALLMPIRWPEPFGLVMTEAMACGTL